MSASDRVGEFPKRSTIEKLVEELSRSFSLNGFSEKVNFDSKYAKLLKFLVDGGYVGRTTVMEYVHFRLVEIGGWTFNEHKYTKQGIDNCLHSHRAFGYALKNESIPASEVAFNHGETAEEYIKSAEGLLEDVVEQLLNFEEASHPKASKPVVWGPTFPLER